MVGQPRSNRCDNCRKRKKKCDEQLPSCSACIRSGWTCPGYNSRWKFIDEAPQLAKQYAGRKYVYDVVDLGLHEPPSQRSKAGVSANVKVVVRTNLKPGQHRQFNIYKTRPKSAVPRYLESNRLRSEFVYCLESNAKGLLVPLRLVGAYFDFIPARLGHNAALDDAVLSICAMYSGSLTTSYVTQKAMYGSYTKALSSLRHCLHDKSLQMEPETLCASILLQLVELVVNVDTGEWSSLACGTALLLQSRGVHRYSDAFDHAMLESQLPYIWGQSMRFEKDCFLRSPEWLAVLERTSTWPYQALQPQSLTLRTRLHLILVDMPGLISLCSTRCKSHPNQADRTAELKNMIHRASTAYEKVQEWLKIELEPLLRSHAPQYNALLDEVEYPDILAAVSDCVANTALLTIHKILRFLRHARQTSPNPMALQDVQRLRTRHLSVDPQIIKGWHHRATSAFDFVQGESVLAAKPLDFGLRQFESGSSSYSFDLE